MAMLKNRNYVRRQIEYVCSFMQFCFLNKMNEMRRCTEISFSNKLDKFCRVN